MAASVDPGLAARGFTALISVHSAAAQPCTETAGSGDSGASILQCGETVIAAEADAVRSPLYALSAHPQAIQLDGGAVAIAKQASASPFAVLTPEAVVTGRDGDWAVVSEAGRTLVRVWRGEATLRIRGNGSETTIRAGETAFEEPYLKRMEALREVLQVRSAR